MLVFAVVIWRSAPKLRDEEQASAVRMAAATLTLTLTNPATILFFVGAFGAVGFAGIGHDTPEHRVNAALVVAGAFCGSMLWWLIVTSVARRLRGRDHRPHPADPQPRHGDRPRRLRRRRRHFRSDRPMTDPSAPRDLATLFAMRLTHDLAGPLGAVSTGVDLLDGGDPEVRSLIADGATAAVASLRLHRFIVAPPDDASVAYGVLAAWVATREAVTLDWRAAPSAAAIVLGLAMTAAEAARRGGTLTVDGDDGHLRAAARCSIPASPRRWRGAPVTISRAALAGILYAVRRQARRATLARIARRRATALTCGSAYHGSALPR